MAANGGLHTDPRGRFHSGQSDIVVVESSIQFGSGTQRYSVAIGLTICGKDIEH